MAFSSDMIAKYLQDPLSFPPEFKSWFVKYLEQHQPELQAGLLAGKLPTSKLTGQVPYSQLTLAGSIVNADINASAAIGIGKLADPTTGKVIGSSGGAAAAVYPPGYEINYTQITSPVTVSATTEASGTTLFSPGAIVFDGGPVLVHVYSPIVGPASNDTIWVSLFEGATQIGELGLVTATTGGVLDVPFNGWYRFTPTAGSHTYTVTAYRGAANGTFYAGAGGTAAKLPAFIRFTKV